MHIFCFVNSDTHLPQFMEGLRLRVKDVDLDDRQVLVVRKATDDKDGVARPARSTRFTACLPDNFSNQWPCCH